MDPLDRLYWRLAETLRRAPTAPPDQALTVADVYQTLVPYRGVRSDLGLYELAEYEHALLRLLAGERGYVRIEDAEAQAELQRELASPNPILGLYRDYAELRLSVELAAPAAPPAPPAPATAQRDPAAQPGGADDAGAPPAGDLAAGGEGPSQPAPAAAAAPLPMPTPTPTPTPAPSAGGSASPRRAPEPGPAARGVERAGPPVPAARPAPVSCGRCRAQLPRGREVRFCPFCGVAQPTPCGGCGAPVEPAWAFCARCGQPRQPAPPSR